MVAIPYLKKRQRIIRQARRAHRRNEYALSSALLPLVEPYYITDWSTYADRQLHVDCGYLP